PTHYSSDMFWTPASAGVSGGSLSRRQLGLHHAAGLGHVHLPGVFTAQRVDDLAHVLHAGGAGNMRSAHSRESGNPPNKLYQRYVLDPRLRGGERRFTVTPSAWPSPCRWPWPCPSARRIYMAGQVAPVICLPLIPAKAGIHPTNYTSDMFWTPASAGVSGGSLSPGQLRLHHAAGLGHVHLPGVFTWPVAVAPIICSPLIPAEAGIHPTDYTSDVFWISTFAGVSGGSLSPGQ